MSSENCCPRDMYFDEKMLTEKQIVQDMLMRRRLLG